jgi:hypothetical protein
VEYPKTAPASTVGRQFWPTQPFDPTDDFVYDNIFIFIPFSSTFYSSATRYSCLCLLCTEYISTHSKCVLQLASRILVGVWFYL